MKKEELLNDDFLKQFNSGEELNDFLKKIQKRGIEKMDMPLRLKSEYLECTTYEYTVLVEECTEWPTVTEWGDDVTGETCIP